MEHKKLNISKRSGVILNGTNKGKIVDFSNEYTYTGMLKQKYHKGDKVLLNGSENNVGSSIQCVKEIRNLLFCLVFNIGIDDDCGKERLAYNCDSGNQYCDIYSRIPKSGDDADVVAICNKMVIFLQLLH